MANKNRATTSAVADKLARLEDKPYRFGFFSVLRYFDSVYGDRARIGEAVRPADEPVRLGQEPSLAFAPATLASFKQGKRSRLAGFFFGVFGANGPLPLHLTEYARDRERTHNDPTMRAFADIFHHRMMAFFYRGWANTEPAVSLDRPDSRRFDAYVGAVLGIAAPEFAARDAIDDNAKRFWAGRLGLATRPAEGLQAMLIDFFGVPFVAKEFVGEWLRLAPTDWLRLGERPAAATLGVNAVLGGQVWSSQHRFQLVCGALGFEDFKKFLPGGESLVRLRDMVRGYLGDEFAWDCNLVLKRDEVPAMELGKAGQLGWTTWLGDRVDADDADEVVVDPFFSGAATGIAGK